MDLKIEEEYNLMNVIKRSLSCILAIALMMGLASCSDNSWSMKTNNTSLTIGTYIYYMNAAYNKAASKVENGSSDILSQTIEDKSGTDYVKDEALLSCKKLIATENMFDEMGLYISDEEAAQADKDTNTLWKSYGTIYESLGVAKDSFHRAYTMYNLKYSKILNAKYGDEGSEKISDDEIKSYFTDHYTSYSYFSKDMSSADSNVTTRELESDEEADRIMQEIESGSSEYNNGSEDEANSVENVSKDFEDYSNKINDGTAYEDVFNEFKNKYSESDDKNISSIENLENTNKNSIPNDVLDSLKGLEPLKSLAYNSSEGSLYVLYKHDINSDISFLDTDANKTQVKNECAYEKLDNAVKDIASNLEVEINQKAINKYSPSIIENKYKSKK